MKKSVDKRAMAFWTSAICLVLCLVIFLPSAALATDAPLAELYFYNHPAVGGLSAYDTTGYKTATEQQVDGIGYNGNAYTNVPAGSASSGSIIRTLASDAIFLHNGHSGKGRVVCVDNSNNITRLTANAQAATNAYSLEYNFDNTTGKLKKMRLAWFQGCHTYGTDSTYGSLNTKCSDLGVDCIITQNDSTYASRSTYFAYSFFWYINNRTDLTVSQALAEAKANVLANYDDEYTQATLDTKFTGTSSIKLKPAAYGS